MPLRKGGGLSAMRANIGEILRSYKRKGTIGKIKPKSKGHARRIAVAAAAKAAGVSRKGRRRKRGRRRK